MPIKEVLALMFDKVAIKITRYEQKIDINKMPFGKLHQDEIMNAYGILRFLDKQLDKLSRKSKSYLSSRQVFRRDIVCTMLRNPN
uniref:PARP alpha-helical domain-containing protein n=1 Tax=Acrobeloides nanus TaxID=290746 RepID=A0A914C004_9BILA